ncbi:fructose-bisphosphatase [Thioclava sediminum]|uniref:Fructose-1,6-bisphosphatase class 1 n=1 Tax=Thioclava sediminum TaxID=1915319 RepID=A0ABX3MVU5_9RHOB|nr:MULTISPECIES: class 1 fructose-bisphosphatase [Thioclava]MAQ36721.1 class 1 fructose-bisphosphatase [Thioclava sp.]OOY23491.1 fructose-bisphosphatase [Thioclava sediminum]
MSVSFDGLGISADLADTMTRLTSVGAQLARMIARNGLEGNLAEAAGTNAGGDGQKALDVIADEAFMDALRGGAVRHYASEEQDEVVDFGEGTLALAIDPLDGSSNIDVNVSIGTIFSIFEAADDMDASFLRPANEQIAGGYIIFGPQTALVVTFGKGVQQWVLEPGSDIWRRVADPKPLPSETSEYAINASNYRHWPQPIRAFIDDLVAGAEGPRGRNFNMRWIASLVAETHRIISRGGVFLYPGDDRDGYERGRLRHVYECAPIAMLIEQLGGEATDGADPIMSATPDRLHARTPFVFGSASKVARVAAYHDLPQDEAHALFNTRGLFRS